jgi:hypothetical protein
MSRPVASDFRDGARTFENIEEYSITTRHEKADCGPAKSCIYNGLADTRTKRGRAAAEVCPVRIALDAEDPRSVLPVPPLTSKLAGMPFQLDEPQPKPPLMPA